MAPEDATAPTRAGRGGDTNIQLGGEPKGKSTAVEQTSAAIDAAIVAALLDCRTVAAAADILAAVTADVPDPLLRWAVRLARLAVADGVVPQPAVCAELARQHDDVPPGIAPISTLMMLAADPPLPVNVPWFLARYRETVVRRSLQNVAVRLADVAWRGDIAEVREVVTAEFRALRALFDAAEAAIA